MNRIESILRKGRPPLVPDIISFAKEVIRNRKMMKNKEFLPEPKVLFDGIPLKDYCWLKDEIFRIKQKRIDEGGKDFACKAVMMLSFAFLVSGLFWIYTGPFPAILSFIALSARILEMDSKSDLPENGLLMSFPEYGIWNSGELKDFKYNFENIFKAFNYRGERGQGKEFEKIFKIAGIDYENFTYRSNLKKTSLLLNVFYGLNDWNSTDEMLYDIRKGEFTAEELFKRKNELCSFERNFVSKGRMKFRKTGKDRELERKEIDGKTYWQDEKGFIKIQEQFSELTKFNEKDIRGLLKGVLPPAEKIEVLCGERWHYKGYVRLEGEGRRKHMLFLQQEWKKLYKKEMEEREN